ncbi:MAG: Wzz/FepE/Etk N-terminal domain-containing protein [Clostridiales bacterium]|nr:Wzz/FepE/Etk N-terminal domain-containing protein [Clostridiales bacterium]
MNDQLSITDIIDMLIKRWWIWVITALLFSITAFVYTELFIDPLYKTEGTLYVNALRTQTSDVSSANLTASQELVETYKEILKRRTFLSQISDDLDGRYSVSNLDKMISMSAVNETEILEISVTGKVPEDVYEICHSILLHASDELVRVVNAGSVKILDDGQVPKAPISPNVKTNTLIAFLAGMVIGGLIILVLELFDTRIKGREDIINKYEEPLLGEIPEVITPRRAGDAK